jgi:adenosylmethionine-8-amino-7-oxononanoate aminotransferase
MSTIFHRAPRAKLRGLMVYPMGGTVDGSIGDHVLLAPPFICDSQQIEAIVGRLGCDRRCACGYWRARQALGLDSLQ